MKDRLLAGMARIEPRLLLALMAGVVVLIALEGWLVVLRTPLADYRRLQHPQHAAPVRLRADPSRLQAEIGEMEGELTRLTHALQGQGAPLPVDQMVVQLIGRLDRIAARHRVRLHSVRPSAARRVLMFDEVSSDIKVTGNYRSLFGWLRDTEEELGPLVVTQFSIKIADVASGTLSMDLKLAAYRPAAEGAAKP